VLRLGDIGHGVDVLKKKLVSCGYSVAIESIGFCQHTKDSVTRAQIYYNLDPTGIYDNLTEDLLSWEARGKWDI